MPNATVRANARTLPEATEPAAVHKDSARMEAFSRALCALADGACAA
jgi:hypothetical protein